jgi:hypothetical protein
MTVAVSSHTGSEKTLSFEKEQKKIEWKSSADSLLGSCSRKRKKERE